MRCRIGMRVLTMEFRKDPFGSRIKIVRNHFSGDVSLSILRVTTEAIPGELVSK